MSSRCQIDANITGPAVLLVNANRCPLGRNMNMESGKTQGRGRDSRLALLPSCADQKHTASQQS